MSLVGSSGSGPTAIHGLSRKALLISPRSLPSGSTLLVVTTSLRAAEIASLQDSPPSADMETTMLLTSV